MTTLRPDFYQELTAAGVANAAKCFNCGTCAAVCPLMEGHFPRNMIRYVQIGARERVLEQARDLWRCLHCGLCTRTCPRGAEPGEIIHGLKRYVLESGVMPTVAADAGRS